MKTERRHELQTNELADWLGAGVQAVEKNARTVVGVIVALAVILAAYWYLSSSSQSRGAAGWTEYYEALRRNDITKLSALSEEYKGNNVGAWAEMALADDNLIAGTNDLFVNRATANDRLRAAVSGYQEVLDSPVSSRDQLLKQRALWGLGQTYESLNELDSARATYKQLVDEKNWKPPMFVAEARRRLQSLDKKSTKEFYDWFAQQQPAAPAATPTMPLNLENLPDTPPSSLDADSIPEATGEAPATDASSTESAPESAPAETTPPTEGAPTETPATP